MRKAMFAALLAGAIAVPALAQDVAVSLQSAVFIERLGHTGDGRVQRRIEPAARLKHGDRVVLMVEWQARPAQQGFTVTSAIPATIAFERTSNEAVEVSVDGGKHWACSARSRSAAATVPASLRRGRDAPAVAGRFERRAARDGPDDLQRDRALTLVFPVEALALGKPFE